MTALVTAHCDGTVIKVYAGINSLEGAVGRVAFLIAADDIVSHTEGNHLFVVKHVLNDDNGTAAFSWPFIGILVLLPFTELADTYSDAELLAALWALEHQRLTSRIYRLVKGDELIAFGTTYALHGAS